MSFFFASPTPGVPTAEMVYSTRGSCSIAGSPGVIMSMGRAAGRLVEIASVIEVSNVMTEMTRTVMDARRYVHIIAAGMESSAKICSQVKKDLNTAMTAILIHGTAVILTATAAVMVCSVLMRAAMMETM